MSQYKVLPPYSQISTGGQDWREEESFTLSSLWHSEEGTGRQEEGGRQVSFTLPSLWHSEEGTGRQEERGRQVSFTLP